MGLTQLYACRRSLSTLQDSACHPLSPAALLPPPLTRAGIPSGVQAGRQLSVGTLFSPEDRGVAMEVVRDHRGQREGLVACIGWCESPGVGSCIVCR